jgi:hypothetical protein
MKTCSGTQKPVRLEIGFYSLFVWPEGRDVSQVQTDGFWEGEMSPWPIITLIPYQSWYLNVTSAKSP